MLKVDLDKDKGIAILEPNGKLSASDFNRVSKIVDPYLENFGELRGIIIHVKSFPGWDSFASFIAHFKFIKGHHKKISRIALATDSPVGIFAENIVSCFVNADIKKFDFSEMEASRKWILGGKT